MQRGFEVSEFEARLARAQAKMAERGFGALLVTEEADVRYFSGYLTRFWESPTRPWFLVVPASGKPIAVIPSIGAALMRKTWIEDVRTWRAPDYDDDGVSLLADCLRDIGGPAVTPMGLESHLRMPLGDYLRLNEKVSIGSDGGLMQSLRAVKSEAEIAKITHACGIAGRVYDRVGEIAGEGVPLAQVFRDFQRLCLEEGADWVPYVAGGMGQGGYDDVISPASDTPLRRGDVLMLDTGLVWDGYFCDYDRNFAIGEVSEAAAKGYAALMRATAAGLDAARVGATAADVFHAMDRIVTGGKGGSDTGRLGHGLGMQLTEGLSLIPSDHTFLEEGMVITLEPGVDVGDGRMLVHEENVVIRAAGPEMISPRAPEMMEIL